MAIEIYFQNNIKGNDIRGCAFHVAEVFHEYLLHLCVGNDSFVLLDALSVIDEEKNILIQPYEFADYIQELNAVLEQGKDWKPAKDHFAKLIKLFKDETARINGLKCMVDN